ncbi:serine/threonine protein kinase [Zavarzinella formosa]|uniref:serine/threonine protein kinase n=1 Tax=Zavarzinella formosa TaxID=360055 RepID=UPI0002E40255|nr:serine/threonine-protein kinase [Zavarzinella formosa]
MHAGKTFGPFTIEKELGSGAMGTVFRARLTQDGKEQKVVALKVIAFGLSGNESALARFEREANILKQLKHPNIVRLMATGRYKGTPFFAMEYVEGQSLDRVMIDRHSAAPARPPFSWEEIIDMGRPLCDALQHAHDKGIIHRDLKPSNLMVTREGIVKLTDFGIAKDVDVTALTGANNTIGTAAYMSPEQCKGEKHLTGKSDIYSLGIVFYELLTGRKPFTAESSVDMFLLHVNGAFTRPAQINPEIPAALDNLICQMMEKKPEMRPRDATMIGQVLEEIAEKVRTRQSVGGDAANARVPDRRRIGSSEEDMAAAKAIRAGAKKKKLKKKKSQPVYTKGWFVALASLLFVGAFASFFIFVVFAPPSEKSIMDRIEKADTPEKKTAAIDEYLKHYGTKNTENVEKVRSMERDIKVAAREKVLMKRYSLPNLRARVEEGDDKEAYEKTMLALTSENSGDLGGARAKWTELADKYTKETDPAKNLWGWHAKKKLADLQWVEAQPKTIIAKIDDKFRLDDKDIVLDNEDEAKAAAPLRLEQFGDPTLARDRWQQLRDLLASDADRRPWYLLAIGRCHELEQAKQPKDSAERALLIAGKIALAKPLLVDGVPARRRDGRNILRDVRDLYAGESGEIGKMVAEAKKLITESTP